MSGTHATTTFSYIEFNHETLSVTMTAPCYSGARTRFYFTEVKGEDSSFLPIAHQLFAGFKDYFETSDIASVWTVRRTLGDLTHVAEEFQAAGFVDLKDIPLDDLLELDGIAVKKIVAHAVLHSSRSDKDTAAQLLFAASNGRQARGLPANAYADAEDDANELLSDSDIQILRDRSWSMFKDLYDRHAAYTRGLENYLPEGTELEGREWESVPASVIIEAAKARAEATPRGSYGTSSLAEITTWDGVRLGAKHPDEMWDWLLLNPPKLPVGTAAMELLFNDRFRCAALVHHCFMDFRGPNIATMLNTHIDGIVSLGDEVDMVETSKPRAKQEAREATLSLSIEKHLGGFLRAVAAVSKFSRHFRSQWADWEVAGLLYAPHRLTRADSTDFSIEPNRGTFRDIIRADIDGFTLRWGDLREACLRLGEEESPDHELHGQTKRTRTTYDTKCLPTTTLHNEAQEARDQQLERGAQRLSAQDEERLEQLETARKEGTAKNLAVSVCVSNGKDPDASNEPCRRGLAQCFSCPNGIRTYDHIPGLLALQKFCRDVRRSNAAEWETSEARAVLTVVTGVLDAAPQAAVDHWRNEFANDRSLAEQWETLVAVIWSQRSRK